MTNIIITIYLLEKKRKEEAKLEASKLRVWAKGTNSNTSRTERLKALVGGDGKVPNATDMLLKDKEQVTLTAPRRAEKENMTEYIAKKREMFLVQMSLDTKREEIRKLEEKAQLKEEALQRSEQMLEEDAMRFDAFLKENDKKAHDAIKKAEEETKKKQEKSQEIKRLTQQIQALTSEMSKDSEALEDCLKYKTFLDMLTPPEWFQRHRDNQEAKRRAIQKERHDKKYGEWELQKKRLIEQHKKDQEAKLEAAKKQRRNKDQVVEDDDSNKLVIPPAPKLEDEIVEIPEEEPPMYFTEPQQLMDIFAALEEQNLFLIQNSQETEHNLEELQREFKETKLSVEERTGQLQQQIDELYSQIATEEKRAQALYAKRMSAGESADSNGESQKDKEILLAELNSKVRFAYEQCGFDASSKPSTLFMISQLESRLETLLGDIEKMPIDYVIKSEKEKEKKRRERKREEQQALQIKLQEERNKRAIERSMQAPKKRTGKQVMYRSRPIKKENTLVRNDDDDNNDDEMKHLS